LFAQNFDPGVPALMDDPILIADQVGTFPTGFYASFSVSANGVLVYGPDSSSSQLRQLTWSTGTPRF
jgi:hypothetical protein